MSRAPAAPSRSANDDEQTYERSPPPRDTTRLREVKKVVEAGSQRALTKAVGRPTVRQPLSTWAPGLHPTDEPPVLCQSSLLALIGHRRAVSTPIREIPTSRLCRLASAARAALDAARRALRGSVAGPS